MNRREICEIFECNPSTDTEPVEIDEAECIRLEYIENNTENDIISSLISKYRPSYSKEVIRFHIETISTMVNNPRMKYPVSPFSLISLIMNSFGGSYFDIVECFERLSEVEGMARRILIPMIYGLSLRCSQLDATSNIKGPVSVLEVLVGFPSVLDELQDEKYWGLSDEPDETFGFPVHFGFSCKFPCFLDGFMEPFIYKKCDYTTPVREYIGIPMKEVMEISRRSYHALSDHSYKMYSVIHSIIRHSKDTKIHFMRYVTRVVSISKERNKMVFDWRENISDGFAYNMCVLMTRFNRKIVDENMSDKINAENVEDISLESFPSFCYFSKIHLLFTSCIKFNEYIKSLSYESRYIDADGGERMVALKRGIDSKISALNGFLFTTELFVDERSFVDFMTDYTAETEYPWPDFYYKTLLWMQEMIVSLVSSAGISQSLNKVMEDIMDWKSLMFKKEVVRILSYRSPTIRFTMINRVIDYYNSLGRDETRMEPRSIIHMILKEGKVFSRMNVCKRNITFINCMMKDFEYSLSEGLSSIKDIKEDLKSIKELNEELEKIKGHGDEKEKMESMESIEERIRLLRKNVRYSKSKARNSFLYVDGCFDLFTHILDEKADLFLVDEMINNFVRVLNCNLKVITGPGCADLVIKSPEEYGFDAKNLLRRMILVYIRIHSDKFVEMVANDKMYFDIQFFHTALEICESRYLINESDVGELRNLIEMLKNVVVMEKEKDEPVPDEFIDPLTFNPIKNPVRLLTSKITIDRTTYDMLMMNGGIDPFNRMTLTEDMVVEDIDLKKKIDDYHSRNAPVN